MAVLKDQAQKELQAKKIERKGAAAAQKKIDGKQPKCRQDETGKQRDDTPGAVGGKGGETAMVRAKKAVYNASPVKASQGQEIE